MFLVLFSKQRHIMLPLHQNENHWTLGDVRLCHGAWTLCQAPFASSERPLKSSPERIGRWRLASNFRVTLLETNISPTKALLKMIFLFPRWDMLYSSLEGSRYFCPYTRPMMNQNRMLFGVKLPGGAQWNALWHWHAGCRKGWKWFEHHGLK